jgi:hypothetical protein
MMKVLATLATLLLAGTLAFAQERQGGMEPGQSSQSSMGQNTIRGCLTGTAGNYRLVASDGTAYELKGHESDLRKNVGKEVEITASTSPSSQSSAGARSQAGAGAATQTLQVREINKVADTCQSTAGPSPSREPGQSPNQ